MKKHITQSIGIILLILFSSLTITAIGEPKSIYGTVYIDGEIAPEGTLVTLEIDGETFETETIPWDVHNYIIGLPPGYEGKRGYFYITTAEEVPLDNPYIDIGSDIGYIIDLTIEDFTNSKPTAEITSITPSPGYPNQEITFEGTGTDSDGTIQQYQWKLDDGTTKTGQTITHTYTNPRTYTIRFRVQDNGSRWSSYDTETLVINDPGDNQPPHAHHGGPYEGIINQNIQFDASESTDPEDNITTYHWDYGDGTNGTAEITTHKYTTAGTYNVTLIITDNAGLTDTNTTNATITQPKKPDTPIISADTFGNQSEEITFTARANDPANRNIKYEFDWDDGTTDTSDYLASGQTVTMTHIWQDDGWYTITITAINEEGFESETSHTIMIEEKTTVLKEEAEGIPLLYIIIGIIIIALIMTPISLYINKKTQKEQKQTAQTAITWKPSLLSKTKHKKTPQQAPQENPQPSQATPLPKPKKQSSKQPSSGYKHL